MPTTSNFGWTTPADTDLVKDGAAAIRTLGNGIDTSLVDLKGGTTGQILAKASNTDLDFTWTSDATGIQATIFDAKGDLIVATAADTAARLASSAVNGNVLTVDTSTASGLKWAAPAAGGKVLQVVSTYYDTTTTVASTTRTDTGLSLSITPTSATSQILIIVSQSYRLLRSASEQGAQVWLMRGASDIESSTYGHLSAYINQGGTSAAISYINTITFLDSPATTSSTTYKTQGKAETTQNSGSVVFQVDGIGSTMTLLEIGA